MSKNRKRFHWILSLIFLLASLGIWSKTIAGAVLFLIVAVIALPIGPWADLKGKQRAKKWLLSIVLILIGSGLYSYGNTASTAVTQNQTVPSAIETKAVLTPTADPTEKPAESSASESTETSTTTPVPTETPEATTTPTPVPVSLSNIPAYSGSPYVAVNSNKPYFSDDDLTTNVFENYSNLDSLGRCGVAYANVCEEIMPTGRRGEIGSVKPSGWHTVKYDNVDGKYLYNRCHLIGYQLSAENANPKNLITGTRYLNVTGMLPFENMVADYVKETDHHVLYRVTPVFSGNNLLASGVLMEAESVEDKGDGVEFCVYCYNVQPGIKIDYATGNSSGGQQITPKVTATPKPKTVNDNEQAAGAMTAVSKVWNISGGGLKDGATEAQINAAQNAVNALPDSNSNKQNLQQMVDASRNSLRDKLTAQAQADEAARQEAARQAEQQAAAAQQAEQPTQGSGTMVWISETGSKYHSIPNCGRMNPNYAHQETEAQAIAEGYGRCSKCW